MKNKMNRIDKAREKVGVAEKELVSALKAAFVPGTHATYQLGRLYIDCVVTELGVGHGDRVHVRGLTSDKRYWVNGYRLEL